MSVAVLDASALLAYLVGEPGADQVERSLHQGVQMSAVNVAEVLSKLADLGEDPAAAFVDLEDRGLFGLAVEVRPLDLGLALQIAVIRPITRAHGLSLADRACIGLARIEGLPVVTADAAWAGIGGVGVEVRLIR